MPYASVFLGFSVCVNQFVRLHFRSYFKICFPNLGEWLYDLANRLLSPPPLILNSSPSSSSSSFSSSSAAPLLFFVTPRGPFARPLPTGTLHVPSHWPLARRLLADRSPLAP